MTTGGHASPVSRDSQPRRSRRAFLALTAAAVGSLAGCPGGGPETETPVPPDDGTRTPGETTETPVQTTERQSRFDEVIDITEVGGAADGSEPITDLLAEHAADDTLIEFPAGTYAVDHLSLSGLRNVGLRAVDGADVSFVPTAPASELGTTLLRLVDLKRFLFEEIDLDFRAEGDGGMMYVLGTDDFAVRDVTVRGQYPPDVSGFRFEAVTPDSTALVENVRLSGGSTDDSDSVGIYVGHNHAGTLTVRDCVVENFPNNGIYASSPGRQDGLSGSNGPVHVRGGRYRNNNIANVRLGSTGSSVKRATVVVDEVPPRHTNGLDPRGIRMRAREGQVVEDCEVRIEGQIPTSSGGIVLHSEAGRATIRDSTVTVDTDGVPAINALRPADSQRGPVVENVTISGRAATEHAIDITRRNGTRIRGSRIEQTGPRRSGIRFEQSRDCLVADTNFDVTGDPITAIDSEIVRQNVSHDPPEKRSE